MAKALDPYTLKRCEQLARERARIEIPHHREPLIRVAEAIADLRSEVLRGPVASKPRRLTPATTLCGPHWDSKPKKARKR